MGRRGIDRGAAGVEVEAFDELEGGERRGFPANLREWGVGSDFLYADR